MWPLIYAGVRLIRAVASLGGSLTALKDAMPAMVNTPEMRFQSSEDRKFVVVAEVLDRLRAAGATVNETDGARVNTADGWWLLRASNTQDVLVARVEARTEAALARLQGELHQQLAASGVEPVLAGH
jgi:phosphomannomutase